MVLTMENHYKDNYWQYPEFAQKMDVFVEIVDQIDSPWFGVNYDPPTPSWRGRIPLVLLDRVKHRVVSMHASDRYLKTDDRGSAQRGRLGRLRQPPVPWRDR